MNAQQRPRVAIVGASGIGKHHANWWTHEGAEVCAFAGSSAQSLRKAEEGLRTLIPFEGRAYADVGLMLDDERPDIVDVCSPPALHYRHVKEALAAGCAVLCEKPFIYAADLPTNVLRAQAAELVQIAEAKGLQFGLCVQYIEAGGLMKALWDERFPGRPITRFRCHLEAPAKGRAADPERIWADLAPHPLSAIQAVFPQAEVQWSSLRTAFDGYSANAQFDLEVDSQRIACDILTRNSLAQPANVREFAFDDYTFKVEADKDEENVYCARIDTVDGSRHEPDMMRLVMRHFLAGQISAPGRVAIANNDWLLGVLDHARQSRG